MITNHQKGNNSFVFGIWQMKKQKMKTVFFSLIVLTKCLLFSAVAQPEGINYQVAAKDKNGRVAANKNIRVRSSILLGSVEGALVYSELHTAKTNDLGLFGIVIGQGAAVNGAFADIDWAAGKHFLKVEIDPDGGYDFLVSGSFQFLSVPYALYAKQASGFSFNRKLSPLKKEGVEFSFTGGKSSSKESYRGIVATINGTELNGANAAIYGQYEGQSEPTDEIKSEGFGLHGFATGALYNCGVYGETNGSGDINYGLYGYAGGRNKTANYGVMGHAVFSLGNNYGVYGKAVARTTGTNYALYGIARGGEDNYAGFFDGKTRITQALTIGNAEADSFASFAMGDGSRVMNRFAVALGQSVTASGSCAFAIGLQTEAKGANSFAGGEESTSNYPSSFAFGKKCYTYGSNSIALGYTVLSKTGAFGFSDNASDELFEAEENTFSVRASNGVYLYSSSDLLAGVELAPGAGAWATISDINRKENFNPINAEEVLQQLTALPITRWNYKTQATTIQHIGPMAQDFYKAFKLGGAGNDTTITTTDIDGVNMLAIQALAERSKTQKNEIEYLKIENELLKNRLAQIEKMLGEATIKAENTVTK